MKKQSNCRETTTSGKKRRKKTDLCRYLCCFVRERFFFSFFSFPFFFCKLSSLLSLHAGPVRVLLWLVGHTPRRGALCVGLRQRDRRGRESDCWPLCRRRKTDDCIISLRMHPLPPSPMFFFLSHSFLSCLPLRRPFFPAKYVLIKRCH